MFLCQIYRISEIILNIVKNFAFCVIFKLQTVKIQVFSAWFLSAIGFVQVSAIFDPIIVHLLIILWFKIPWDSLMVLVYYIWFMDRWGIQGIMVTFWNL